jgi:hypothetical protein
METKKIFNLINHWLMMGLVFVYSQALSTEFDIARSDNDCHKLASTINPENLPDELNINIHKEMCSLAKNAHTNPLKRRNVLIVHTQSPIKYVFIVSGLSPKQSAFYESRSQNKFPVIDTYDILGLNWNLTQEEKNSIDQIQNEINQEPAINQIQAMIAQIQATIAQIQATPTPTLQKQKIQKDSYKQLQLLSLLLPLLLPLLPEQTKSLLKLLPKKLPPQVVPQALKLLELLEPLPQLLQQLQNQKTAKDNLIKSLLLGKQEKIKSYSESVKKYFNDQDKASINQMIFNLFKQHLHSVEELKKYVQENLGSIAIENAKPRDRISSVNDLVHTEILLRYAMENSIKVTINGIEIDFRDIANQPIINICSINDMCYNCENALADFAQNHPRQKIHVSSVNPYAHPTRYAPFQFGSSTTVDNIFKIAFTDQDGAKSPPPSPAMSPRPSSSSSAEPLPNTDSSESSSASSTDTDE